MLFLPLGPCSVRLLGLGVRCAKKDAGSFDDQDPVDTCPSSRARVSSSGSLGTGGLERRQAAEQPFMRGIERSGTCDISHAAGMDIFIVDGACSRVHGPNAELAPRDRHLSRGAYAKPKSSSASMVLSSVLEASIWCAQGSCGEW